MIEEKSGTYPSNTCVLMGDSILNGEIERNLSNDRLVKIRSSPELLSTTYDIMRYLSSGSSQNILLFTQELTMLLNLHQEIS